MARTEDTLSAGGNFHVKAKFSPSLVTGMEGDQIENPDEQGC